MKPVFVCDSLGCLYQSGYRQLEKMLTAKREFIARDLTLAIAVSQHVSELGCVTVHLEFGDNSKWVGPNEDLSGTITAAANLLEDGKHVMVYCFYGVNRSGLVCALIIREFLGVTGAEALRLLRRSRKGSIGGNPHFVSYLEGLGAP